MDNEEHSMVEPTPPPETKRPWEPSLFQTAQQIADRIGEKQADARTQIVHIVQALGRTQANALLAETLRIEEQGGLPVLSGARRRSPEASSSIWPLRLASPKLVSQRGTTQSPAGHCKLRNLPLDYLRGPEGDSSLRMLGFTAYGR